MNAVVYVDIKQSKRRWPLARPQRWYWVALNANNFRVLARSSENYTNEQDCIDAAVQLFGADTNAFLRRPEHGNVNLRMTSQVK